METFGQKLNYLRKSHKLSLDDLVKQLKDRYETNISKSMISRYENDKSDVTLENVRIFTDFFDVPQDYFIKDNKKLDNSGLPKLSIKEEHDIGKQLEKILKNMDDGTALAFDGEPMDDETKDFVRAAIESNLHLTKQLAKKKFTPKKYRNWE